MKFQTVGLRCCAAACLAARQRRPTNCAELSRVNNQKGPSP